MARARKGSFDMTLRNLTFGSAVVALAAIALPYGAVSAARPAAPAAVAPVRATVAIDKITNPGATLTKLTVVNKDGVKVGTVVDVVTRSDGKAISLTVDTTPLHGKRHWVGINATQIGLDQSRRILVANLTSAQIKALPSLL
jgi:hypothetical protein